MSELRDLDRLEASLGGMGFARHAPVRVDDCDIHATLRPADGETLGRALSALTAGGFAALIRGGGTRMSLGNPPRRADLFLSTEALRGVDVFDSEDGVVHVLGGTPLAALRAEVSSQGCEVPLDPPGDRSTLGGTLATAAIGPRRLAFGSPRDCVLGMEIALGSGERTRCGGRVVKNVTGYDLAKLYTGSFGSLGVIEAAWLRLRPLPERVEVRIAALSSSASMPAGETLEQAIELSRRESARVVALVSPGLTDRWASVGVPESHWLLVSELAGHAAAVDRDLGWMGDRFDSVSAGSDCITVLNELQGDSVQEGSLRARVAVLPSALPSSAAALRSTGAELLIHPGLGLVYALHRIEAGPEEGAWTASMTAIAETAGSAGGAAVFEQVPSHAKRGFDVLGDPGPALPLMRRLKERFDPGGVLNPGRCAGGL